VVGGAGCGSDGRGARRVPRGEDILLRLM
jgi:hypothetical protein